jgi:UPF0755 protein
MSDRRSPPSQSSSTRRKKKKRSSTDEDFGVGRALRYVLLVFGALVALSAIGLLLVYPSRKGPGTGKPVAFQVQAGEGTFALAERLADAGLLGSSKVFAIYALSQGGSKGIAVGAHLLTDDVSPGELLRRLQRFGMADRVKVTFPEGFTRFDMARRLEEKHVCTAESFLAATTKPELLQELGLEGSAEGYLFPATYDLVADADAADLVRRMKTEFDKRLAAIELAHSASRAHLNAELGFGTKQLVILASMVEKEAAVDEERPMVASVFVNRLHDPSFKRKLLQCDPTAGYGCLVLRDKIPACAGFTGKITHDINFAPENTYSTYTHEGLPPGPIANPGAKSLAAAFQPANTRYFFFVARGGGRHAFSETLDEHNAAVKESGTKH